MTSDEAMEAHIGWIRRALDEMRTENLHNFARLSAALETHKTENATAHQQISAMVASTTGEVEKAKTTIRVLRAVAVALGGMFLTACSFLAWVYGQFRGGI